jgi:hypothetical protein
MSELIDSYSRKSDQFVIHDILYRHSGSPLAGIQPGASTGFPLQACGNDERGYTGITNENTREYLLSYLRISAHVLKCRMIRVWAFIFWMMISL